MSGFVPRASSSSSRPFRKSCPDSAISHSASRGAGKRQVKGATSSKLCLLVWPGIIGRTIHPGRICEKATPVGASADRFPLSDLGRAGQLMLLVSLTAVVTDDNVDTTTGVIHPRPPGGRRLLAASENGKRAAKRFGTFVLLKPNRDLG